MLSSRGHWSSLGPFLMHKRRTVELKSRFSSSQPYKPDSYVKRRIPSNKNGSLMKQKGPLHRHHKQKNFLIKGRKVVFKEQRMRKGRKTQRTNSLILSGLGRRFNATEKKNRKVKHLDNSGRTRPKEHQQGQGKTGLNVRKESREFTNQLRKERVL